MRSERADGPELAGWPESLPRARRSSGCGKVFTVIDFWQTRTANSGVRCPNWDWTLSNRSCRRHVSQPITRALSEALASRHKKLALSRSDALDKVRQKSLLVVILCFGPTLHGVNATSLIHLHVYLNSVYTATFSFPRHLSLSPVTASAIPTTDRFHYPTLLKEEGSIYKLENVNQPPNQLQPFNLATTLLPILPSPAWDLTPMNANDGSRRPALANIRTRSTPVKHLHVPLQLDFNALAASHSPPLSTSTASSTPITNHHLNHSNLPPPPLSAGAESSTSTNSVRTPTPTNGLAPEPSTPNTEQNAANSPSPPKEKRKRSRVTPEQLAQLEKIFILDKSPTAQRRKEISDMLVMQERQTQIWFQNRRAKAKLQEVKRSSITNHISTSNSPPPPTTPQTPHTPSDPGKPIDSDLLQLLHEDDVNIIPCTELSVGSWRRIATDPPISAYGYGAASKVSQDLIAYFSTSRRCINWFIHSDGFGFKMEIPFEVITNFEFSDAPSNGGAQALATFYLSRPPNFYLEQPTGSPPPVSKGSISIGGYTAGSLSGKTWKRCADWTEGMQATTVLRHDLIGSAPQVMQAIQALREDVHHPQLLTPQPLSFGNHQEGARAIMRPQLAQTPVSPLRGDANDSAGYGYVESTEIHHLPSRQRNFVGPSSYNDSYPGGQQNHPDTSSYASSPAAYSHHPSLNSGRATFSHDYSYEPPSPPFITPSHSTHSALSDYSNIPIAQATHSQPRSTPISHPPASTPPNSIQPSHDHHYGTSSVPFAASVSPPLLTTPFSPDDGAISNGHDTISHHTEDMYTSNHNGHSAIGMEYGVTR